MSLVSRNQAHDSSTGLQSVSKYLVVRFAPSVQNSKDNLIENSAPFLLIQNFFIDPGHLQWRILKRTTAHRTQHTVRDPVLREDPKDLPHLITKGLDILWTSCNIWSEGEARHP